MGAGRIHTAVVYDINPVRIGDGGKPVGNDDQSLSLHQFCHGRLDHRLIFRVHIGTGLIQDHDRRVLQHGPGDGNPLPLAAGGFSNMTNLVFWDALKEAAYMGIFVFIFSNLWGNRIGAAFAARHSNPEKDNPYICRLLRQAGTVAIMCPTMSLVASILFNVILAGDPVTQLPAIWVGTFLKNFPMAFFWNMFAAAPFTHWVFGKIFREE